MRERTSSSVPFFQSVDFDDHYLWEGEMFDDNPMLSKEFIFDSDEAKEKFKKMCKAAKPGGVKLETFTFLNIVILFPRRLFAHAMNFFEMPSALRNYELGHYSLHELVKAVPYTRAKERCPKTMEKLLALVVRKKERKACLQFLELLLKWWPKDREDSEGNTIHRNEYEAPGIHNRITTQRSQ